MIIFNKLDNCFVVSANSQTFLGFEMTANFRDTSPLKCYYDQNFMSRMKQKYVLYSLSDVAVPVLVTEMKFGPLKLKILSLENWCFRVRHYEFMFQ